MYAPRMGHKTPGAVQPRGLYFGISVSRAVAPCKAEF
jgi:hypothetical protein